MTFSNNQKRTCKEICKKYQVKKPTEGRGTPLRSGTRQPRDKRLGPVRVHVGLRDALVGRLIPQHLAMLRKEQSNYMPLFVKNSVEAFYQLAK